MFYRAESNQYINEGMAFTIDGVQYPQNWLNLSTPEEKVSIGLVEVIATNSPANPQYYWVSEELNGPVLTYVNTPKDLDECKNNAITQTNQTAYSLLFPTDWMVVKAFETSTPIPADWNTWRAEVRTTANDARDQIAAATNVDELAAMQINWPVQPA